jgi:dUTP pyrophosphatase
MFETWSDYTTGEKIAQVIFHQHQIAAFEEVNELEESVRGEGGYGSTGS